MKRFKKSQINLKSLDIIIYTCLSELFNFIPLAFISRYTTSYSFYCIDQLHALSPKFLHSMQQVKLCSRITSSSNSSKLMQWPFHTFHFNQTTQCIAYSRNTLAWLWNNTFSEILGLCENFYVGYINLRDETLIFYLGSRSTVITSKLVKCERNWYIDVCGRFTKSN